MEGREPSPDSDEDSAQPRGPHVREGSREAGRRSPGPAIAQHMPPSKLRCSFRHTHGACNEQTHSESGLYRLSHEGCDVWVAGTKDGTAPWMNSNSIVSMLAEAASPPATARPVVPVEVVSMPAKGHSKHKKQDKVSKKRSKERSKDKRAERRSRQVHFCLVVQIVI